MSLKGEKLMKRTLLQTKSNELYIKKKCNTCSKANVCKYKDDVTEKMKKLSDEAAKTELPIVVYAECKEYMGITGTVR